jgi:hypothetical protein
MMEPRRSQLRRKLIAAVQIAVEVVSQARKSGPKLTAVEDNLHGNETQWSELRLKSIVVKDNPGGNEMWWKRIASGIDAAKRNRNPLKWDGLPIRGQSCKVSEQDINGGWQLSIGRWIEPLDENDKRGPSADELKFNRRTRFESVHMPKVANQIRANDTL